MPTIDVTLPRQSYQITIEPGALERVGTVVASVARHERALLAVDRVVADTHGRVARSSLEAAGFEVLEHRLDAEESRKTLDAVAEVYETMIAGRLERGSPVVAVGGGVIGDVAGFAAATWLRGVPLVQVPTTLLAMVDASIGGKTGVNFPRPADAEGRRELGKNLVGAFWQPRAIVTDPRVLATLAPRDFRCGLAECVKHGMIADEDLLAFIETGADRLAALDETALVELIAHCAQIKAEVVARDEREAGLRMLLNLGHTFAHVIEPIGAQDLRHGEAVAIGLCAASACAVSTGRLDAIAAGRVPARLDRLGLPTRLARPEDAGRLVEAMAWDKKVRGGSIRLVLPTGPGRAEVVDDVPREAILAAWGAVGART